MRIAEIYASLQGEGRWLYASEGGRGVHAIDVRDPRAPRHAGFAALARPRGLDLAGDRLYVADGPGGLAILDVSTPAQPTLLGRAPTVDAHAVKVRWPHAYVADGAGGLWILDVRTPQETAAGIIPGAVLIPIDDLESRRSELPRDGRKTLVYCAGGGRSAVACEYLSREGYGELYNLEGGFTSWSGPRAKP